MIPLLRCLLLLIGLLSVQSAAQAQQGWFDADVAREIGIETCTGCVPNFDSKILRKDNSTFYSYHIAHLDTTAAVLRGRVFDAVTHQPVVGAIVEIRFGDYQPESCEVKTAATDSKGFFRLNGVGSTGPNKSANRQLTVRAKNHQTITIDQIHIGGFMYLHIELSPLTKR